MTLICPDLSLNVNFSNVYLESKTLGDLTIVIPKNLSVTCHNKMIMNVQNVQILKTVLILLLKPTLYSILLMLMEMIKSLLTIKLMMPIGLL